MRSRRDRFSEIAPSGPSGSRWSPDRRASRSPTGSSRRRRAANPTMPADDGSSHCTSSMATTSGCDAASARKAPRNPMATARWSGGWPRASTSERPTSSALRWGPGNFGKTSSRHPSSKSPIAANENAVSASTGRAARTVNDEARAASTQPATASSCRSRPRLRAEPPPANAERRRGSRRWRRALPPVRRPRAHSQSRIQRMALGPGSRLESEVFVRTR